MSKITIKEVAKKARVSTATVSRVLNNNYPVSEEVKERVYDVIKELNYSPNAIARSLKNNKTNLIGFVVGDISNPYFMKIAREIEDGMRPKGYNMIMAVTHEDPELEKKLLKVLFEKRVDSIVIAPSGDNSEQLKNLIDGGVKLIAIDRQIGDLNIDTVLEDNFSASYDLVELLIKNGHERIAIINGRLNVTTGTERLRGFKASMKSSDIEIKDEYLLYADFDSDKAYNEVKKLLSNDKIKRPTAIFATNNRMAEGAMIAIEELGYKIPEDISVVSYGDLSIGELVEPRLTVVKQDGRAIGRKVCNILLESTKEDNDENNFKEYILCPRICIGESIKRI
ncbi:LacI family DNA-binding transcriptional regulator [uncultured Clostridium sp.]|uniref:LacI family DNA-binding transcriptional regulator n=1 Tax=uncultured Clostridium sp. TaxID=59620 RepID=UPI0028E977DF|nr:LacI family DNA-binding transcriptional regulator [uncultured Clostridium sp.]